MFEKSIPIFFYTETPLHAGTGAELSTVDLPIQRERITEYPMVQASSLKGAMRSVAEQRPGADAAVVKAVFGPRSKEIRVADDAFAGAVSPTDARLVLFPVRCVMTGFVWVTSRLALARLKRDLEEVAGITAGWCVPEAEAGALVTTRGTGLLVDGKLILEDQDFEAKGSKDLDKIAEWLGDNAISDSPHYKFWRDKLLSCLVVLPEEPYGFFLRFSTEIIPRVLLEQGQKKVDKGPWYEEALPSECLLYSLLHVTKPRWKDGHGLYSAREVVKYFRDQLALDRMQIGGDETTGRGFLKVRLLG